MSGKNYTGNNKGRNIERYTPYSMTEQFLKYHNEIDFNCTVLEPCCGDGAIVKILKKYFKEDKIICYDIKDGEDKNFLLNEYNKYDYIIRNDIEKFDPDSIIQNIMNGKTEACGCAPIVSMLKASKKLGASHSKVLHYSDSSTVFGDKSSVVGYLSAVIWKPV